MHKPDEEHMWAVRRLLKSTPRKEILFSWGNGLIVEGYTAAEYAGFPCR